MKGRILALLLATTLVLSLSGCGQDPIVPSEEPTESQTEETKESEAEDAKEKEAFVTQEFEFYSDDEHLILYNFPEVCEIDGKNYALFEEEEIDYETLGTRDTVQTMVEYRVEELTEIPDNYTFKGASGKKYDLLNEQVYIQEQGLIKIPVIENVYYENQLGKPSVPSSKTITYYDKALGKDATIRGLLSSFTESTAGRWKNILEIEGTFMAPSESCDVYELTGANHVTVSRAAATPAWDGYEADIMTAMGLDGKYFRITGAAWNGAQYEQNGTILRNALFTGDMFVATYKATYEAEREAQGYVTKVFYRVDADAVDAKEEDITTVYHIKAVVKYKLVE